MWFLEIIRDNVVWVRDIFLRLHDLCDAVPLLGGVLGGPFGEIADWLTDIIIHLDEFIDWTDDVWRRLDDILSWDAIQTFITNAWPMDKLYEILSWDDIKTAITDAWPMGKLYDILSWDTIKTAITNAWPMGKLYEILSFDQINEWLRQHFPWLYDPVGNIKIWIDDWFIERFWGWVEDRAEDAVKTAGRILNYVWDLKIWD